MNFEQLLEGANDPNPFKATMIWGLAQNRLSPDVMREVWAALKDVSSKIHDFEAGKINWNADFAYRVDRALALLDGQTEKGGCGVTTPTISEAARRAATNPPDQKTAFKMSAAFLTLPLHRKIEIAKSLGAPANTNLSDLEMCKGVFKWVVDNNRIDDLMAALGVQQALDSAHPAPKEGETPICDAAKRNVSAGYGGDDFFWAVPLQVARSLELRLAEKAQELENHKAGTIHSCGDHCQRPLCVANREKRALRTRLNEAERLLRSTTERLAEVIKDEFDDPSVGITGWNEFHEQVSASRAVLRTIFSP